MQMSCHSSIMSQRTSNVGMHCCDVKIIALVTPIYPMYVPIYPMYPMYVPIYPTYLCTNLSYVSYVCTNLSYVPMYQSILCTNLYVSSIAVGMIGSDYKHLVIEQILGLSQSLAELWPQVLQLSLVSVN